MKKKKKKKKKIADAVNTSEMLEHEGGKNVEKNSTEKAKNDGDMYVDRRTKSERRFDEVQVRRQTQY